MRATSTLPQRTEPHSSNFRMARQALLSMRESHSVALTLEGNCHARDLVERWVDLTGQSMPIDILRQELRIYMYGAAPDYRTECALQRLADEALAESLINGDVRLVRRERLR
jgi:hypothetical protein